MKKVHDEYWLAKGMTANSTHYDMKETTEISQIYSNTRIRSIFSRAVTNWLIRGGSQSELPYCFENTARYPHEKNKINDPRGYRRPYLMIGEPTTSYDRAWNLLRLPIVTSRHNSYEAIQQGWPSQISEVCGKTGIGLLMRPRILEISPCNRLRRKVVKIDTWRRPQCR